MDKQPDDLVIDPVEQKVAIQMVAFSMIIIVVILTLVSFIRIYSSRKDKALKLMKGETVQLQTVITDHLNYSIYFTNMIGKNIQSSPDDLNRIYRILKNQFVSQEFNHLFGWKKYSWTDKNFLELVTSSVGVIEEPRRADYVKEALSNEKFINNDSRNKISFYTSHNPTKGASLKIIDSIMDANKEYLGSVILSYDINTMIQSLNSRKNHQNTNFVILNENLQVIAQSKPSINNVINTNAELDINLQKALRELHTNTDDSAINSSYFDMLTGVNYFIAPLKELPFTIIVNINNDEIRQGILDSLTRKFIEVCLFALFSLFVIISLYKRETFLRTKAEKATLIANNATKAKTNFLAFTAHEIRSPLGFILTGSEIMTNELMGKLPAEYKQYAHGINGNAQIILDFITDILDESQIIEGKFKIINTLNNIKNIIDEAIKTNLTCYSKRRVNIVTQLDDNIPSLICDQRRMAQVFRNLISNSIKYSNDDTTIKITGKVIRDGLEIKIIDQGIGMSEDEIPIALSSYGTINNSDYSNSSYGLGLPIVKMLLDAHDATISINSAKGTGTIVTIVFPKYKLIYSAD